MKTDFSTNAMFVNYTNAQLLSSECSTGAGDGGGAGGEVATPPPTEHPLDHGRRLLALARAGDTAGVRACMAGGAPFAADWLGNTPLHAAAAGDHADVIKVLLRAGGSRDARTKVDRTPLHVSCWLGHVAATRALLAAGADVGARDMLQMTPLHWAAQRGHLEVARLLVAAGADSTVRNKFHLTPRELASRAHHVAIVDLIDGYIRSTANEQAHAHAQRMHDEEQANESDADDLAELVHIPVTSSPPAATPTPAPAPNPAASSGATLTPELLLQRHGITLLGGDADGTVLRALSNGRTVVLSDAGKLMLKEASEPKPSVPLPVSTTSTLSASSGTSSMVVRATPVRSPPAKGTVFTVNARLNAAVTPTVRPVRKVIHPKDLKLDGSGGRVKIVMNRANFRRLVASANAGNTSAPFTFAGVNVGATPAATERVSESDTDTNKEQNVVETANRLPLPPNDSDTLTTTRKELATTYQQLSTVRSELATTRNELTTVRDELETTRNELTTTRNKLEQLESALRSAGLTLTEWEP